MITLHFPEAGDKWALRNKITYDLARDFPNLSVHGPLDGALNDGEKVTCVFFCYHTLLTDRMLYTAMSLGHKQSKHRPSRSLDERVLEEYQALVSSGACKPDRNSSLEVNFRNFVLTRYFPDMYRRNRMERQMITMVSQISDLINEFAAERIAQYVCAPGFVAREPEATNQNHRDFSHLSKGVRLHGINTARLLIREMKEDDSNGIVCACIQDFDLQEFKGANERPGLEPAPLKVAAGQGATTSSSRAYLSDELFRTTTVPATCSPGAAAPGPSTTSSASGTASSTSQSPRALGKSDAEERVDSNGEDADVKATHTEAYGIS